MSLPSNKLVFLSGSMCFIQRKKQPKKMFAFPEQANGFFFVRVNPS